MCKDMAVTSPRSELLVPLRVPTHVPLCSWGPGRRPPRVGMASSSPSRPSRHPVHPAPTLPFLMHMGLSPASRASGGGGLGLGVTVQSWRSGWPPGLGTSPNVASGFRVPKEGDAGGHCTLGCPLLGCVWLTGPSIWIAVTG